MASQLKMCSEHSESLRGTWKEKETYRRSGRSGSGSLPPKRNSRNALACSSDEHEAWIFSHIRGLSSTIS